MPFKNIARYGYQQTVAGTWELGHGVTLSFDIEDPRAERFTMRIYGPTTAHMQAQERISQIGGVRLRGAREGNVPPAALTGRGAAALALLNVIKVVANSAPLPDYTLIRRSAFALGAPIYHNSLYLDERKRGRFERALEQRGTRGLGDLSWVAEHYMDVVDAGPYFEEEGGRRWWEAGFIVVPQSVPAAYGSSANVPTDVLMRVRTDLYGNNLYLELYSTYNHRVINTVTGIYTKQQQQVTISAPRPPGQAPSVRVIEEWE